MLVVEDEISVRWPLADHLRQTGWAVIETRDAAEAMQVINSGATIDIAFVDFRLPGGPTGYMFAQWLANVRPTVPVLLTSGLTSRAPGFIDGELRRYIAKPYAFSEVSRMLTEMSSPISGGEKPANLMTVSQTGATARIEQLHRAEFKPDIVLLDLGLPGVDGYEVARTIRRQPELGNPFLVAVTGWSAPEARLRTKQTGFDEHLTKPVDISMIELLLTNLPERRAGGRNSPIASGDTIDMPQ